MLDGWLLPALKGLTSATSVPNLNMPCWVTQILPSPWSLICSIVEVRICCIVHSSRFARNWSADSQQPHACAFSYCLPHVVSVRLLWDFREPLNAISDKQMPSCLTLTNWNGERHFCEFSYILAIVCFFKCFPVLNFYYALLMWCAFEWRVLIIFLAAFIRLFTTYRMTVFLQYESHASIGLLCRWWMSFYLGSSLLAV